MYEAHFSLISKPFGTKAEGPAVFVGPQQANILSAIHKGLVARDAVVTVTGPVGVGKTTVVNRALETIHPGRMAAWVGRMAISSDEVLELLLAGFGFKRKTNSTLQRFAAFRRLLHERAATGIPVAIVIEDARKLGAAALAEVEALTAADTADGGGANIILMGDAGLEDLLSDPDLARLKQRIRRRQRVEPLSQAEVRGYLRHAVRSAGGDSDNLFGPGVAEIVAACSEGIPRILNTLCETALTSAMEAGVNTVSAELMHQTAVDAYGFEGDLPLADTPIAVPAVATPAAEEKIAVPEPESGHADIVPKTPHTPEPAPPSPAEQVADDGIPESARNIIVETGRYPLEPEDEPDAGTQEVPAPEVTASHQMEPLIVADDEPTLTDIPELINDTQPELDVLPASASSGTTAQDSEDAFDLDAALVPEVESTNMMPGITPNLDAIAHSAESTVSMPVVTENLDELAASDDGRQSAMLGARAFNPDDIPTLSDAMRVEFEDEAENTTSSLHKGDAAPAADQAGAKAEATSPVTEPPVEEAVKDAVENDNSAATPFDLDSALQSRQEPASISEADTAVEAPAEVDNGAEPHLDPEVDPEPDPAPQVEHAAEPQPQVQRADLPQPRVELEDEPAGVASPACEDSVRKIPVVTQSGIEPLDDAAPVMADPLTDSAPIIPEADLSALQAALDAVKTEDVKSTEDQEVPGAPANVATESAGDDMPDIAFDRVIADQQTKNEEMDDFAKAIGGAGSLEETNDALVDTVVGEEFEEAAAAALEMGRGWETAEGHSVVPAASNEKMPATEVNSTDQVEDAAEYTDPIQEPGSSAPGREGLRDSVALRIDVLNKMKNQIDNDRNEVVEMGDGSRRETTPPARGPQPEPIERQINTSMTQALEALNVTKVADAVAAEDEEKSAGGFFSKFRRSS